jgi:signal transduction histidine kinase
MADERRALPASDAPPGLHEGPPPSAQPATRAGRRRFALPAEAVASSGALRDLLRAPWFGYAFALLAVGVVTFSLIQWTQVLARSDATLYLVVVVITAALYGRGPAVLASAAAFFSFDYFFVEPRLSVTLYKPDHWPTLVLFLLTAGVTGQLAATLRQRAEEARTREREALALYEVARQVPGSTLELRPLLGLILDQLRTLVPYGAAEIIALEGEECVVVGYRGPLPRERAVGFHLPRESQLRQLVEEVVRRREPVVIQDLGGPSLLARDLAAAGVPLPPDTEGRVGSELSVPLVVKGTAIGVQTLLHPTPRYYTARHAQLVSAFAQQAAAAIANARLYEATRELAALEERQKLARELHDSVSQVLYGIAVNTATVRKVLAVSPSQAESLLNDVVSLAQAGLAEMRALIFQLRPEALEQEGLLAAFQKQADAMRARHGIAVDLEVEGEPDVPLAVKAALFRIVQEALHNTVKHARARQVTLRLERTPVRLVLEVADDGRGFDPNAAAPGHLGLSSMRERVAALAGTLEIDSAPGQGTRVRAAVPLSP